MKVYLFAVLMGIWMWGVQNVPDPPLPDAAEFCAMNHKDDKAKCSCADMEMGGNACKANDNDRPRMCKWQCGHAKSCGCCVS